MASASWLREDFIEGIMEHVGSIDLMVDMADGRLIFGGCSRSSVPGSGGSFRMSEGRWAKSSDGIPATVGLAGAFSSP